MGQHMNIFEETKLPAPGTERFDTLCSASAFRIERILSNRLNEGTWYDQESDEWVILVQGEAALEYRDGTTATLKAGDHLFIPAHTPHRVLSTSEDALWLAVHAKV
jgi:cupin 2 domain-containing protein